MIKKILIGTALLSSLSTLSFAQVALEPPKPTDLRAVDLDFYRNIKIKLSKDLKHHVWTDINNTFEKYAVNEKIGADIIEENYATNIVVGYDYLVGSGVHVGPIIRFEDNYGSDLIFSEKKDDPKTPGKINDIIASIGAYTYYSPNYSSLTASLGVTYDYNYKTLGVKFNGKTMILNDGSETTNIKDPVQDVNYHQHAITGFGEIAYEIEAMTDLLVTPRLNLLISHAFASETNYKLKASEEQDYNIVVPAVDRSNLELGVLVQYKINDVTINGSLDGTLRSVSDSNDNDMREYGGILGFGVDYNKDNHKVSAMAKYKATSKTFTAGEVGLSYEYAW